MADNTVQTGVDNFLPLLDFNHTRCITILFYNKKAKDKTGCHKKETGENQPERNAGPVKPEIQPGNEKRTAERKDGQDDVTLLLLLLFLHPHPFFQKFRVVQHQVSPDKESDYSQCAEEQPGIPVVETAGGNKKGGTQYMVKAMINRIAALTVNLLRGTGLTTSVVINVS
jgi:hypothetical protein